MYEHVLICRYHTDGHDGCHLLIATTLPISQNGHLLLPLLHPVFVPQMSDLVSFLTRVSPGPILPPIKTAEPVMAARITYFSLCCSS